MSELAHYTCLNPMCEWEGDESQVKLAKGSKLPTCPECNGIELFEGVRIKDVTISISGRQFALESKVIRQYTELYDEAKREIDQLRHEKAVMNTVVDIMANYVGDSLEMFEALFESDENIFKPEDLIRYLTIATYMEKRFGRQTLARRVKAKLDALPWNHD